MEIVAEISGNHGGKLENALRLIRAAIDAGAETVLRMEHVSLIRPDQIERFSASGITAVIQPAFLASESEWVEGRVGPQRSGWLYPFRSLIEAGIPVVVPEAFPFQRVALLCGWPPSAVVRHRLLERHAIAAGHITDDPIDIEQKNGR